MNLGQTQNLRHSPGVKTIKTIFFIIFINTYTLVSLEKGLQLTQRDTKVSPFLHDFAPFFLE